MKNSHPMMMTLKKSMVKLPTPSSISYAWNMGSLLGLTMVIQMVTGIFLSSHYNPSIKEAFNSILHIMRETNYGYEIRFIHMNTASLFFVFIFTHISRSMLMSSFKLKYTWSTGMTILLILMGTAFLGYVLPWGQMSFWGATVITNLVSAVPYLGKSLVEWLWGGFSISNATLNRFFSLHFIFPFVLVFMIMMHLMSLHMTGSSKPLGTKPYSDNIMFHPFFSMKDLLPVLMTMLIITLISNFFPMVSSDSENFNLANPLNTPIHIQPEWYFLFAYAILRSIPNKLGGVMALLMSILMLLPLMLVSKKKSAKKMMPNMKNFFWMFSMLFLLLTFMGSKPIENPFDKASKILSMIYFMFLVVN